MDPRAWSYPTTSEQASFIFVGSAPATRYRPPAFRTSPPCHTPRSGLQSPSTFLPAPAKEETHEDSRGEPLLPDLERRRGEGAGSVVPGFAHRRRHSWLRQSGHADVSAQFADQRGEEAQYGCPHGAGRRFRLLRRVRREQLSDPDRSLHHADERRRVRSFPGAQRLHRRGECARAPRPDRRASQRLARGRGHG